MHSPIISVFGGSGFLGRFVVHALAEAGYRVRVCVRDVEAAGTMRPMGNTGQVVPWPANITDPASVQAAVTGADGVVNLVGIMAPWGKNTFDGVHHQGAKTLAQAAADAGVWRLVHISALGAEQTSPSAYARSKALGETAVRTAFSAATILRPGVIFGFEDGFLCRFAALMKQMPGIMMVPGATFARPEGPLFQPVYAGDVAQAVLYALDKQDALGKTYCLGGSGVYTLKHILSLISTHTGRRRMFLPLPPMATYGIGLFCEYLPKFLLPRPCPPLTRDQAILLQQDSILPEGFQGLTDMGIAPIRLESMLDTCLKRFVTTQKRAIREDMENHPA